MPPLSPAGRRVFRLWRRFAWAAVFAASFAGLVRPPCANASQLPASLTVNVRTQSGVSLDSIAVTITVCKSSGELIASGSAFSGRAEFSNLAPGSYEVTASAPLFHSATVAVDVFGSTSEQIDLILRPVHDTDSVRSPSAFLLSPKLRKELSSALAALRANKPDAAEKHVEAATRLAPGNPDVNFVRGLYFAQTGDNSAARASWQKAISVDSKYTPAMLQLGTLGLRSANYSEARDYFSSALTVNPRSWRAHELLAIALLRQGNFSEAAGEAEESLRFGHQQAIGANIVLAEADLALQNVARAREALRTLLASQPSTEQTASANRLMALIDASQGAPQYLEAAARTASGASQAAPPSPAASPQSSESALETEITVPVDSVEPASWLPASVAEKFPAVESGPACSLPDVLSVTAQRVDEFVSSLERFTASEDLQHEVVSPWGARLSREDRTFRYTALVTRHSNGSFYIQETRNGTGDLSIFPDQIATIGLPSTILIFHAQLRDDFEMACEGLSRPVEASLNSPANSRPAWQIYFRQKANRPSRIRGYRTSLNAPVVGVPLQGRAWIDVATGNVIRIETDLVAPVAPIHLAAEHQLIEFAPVRFALRSTELWLPKSAEIFWEWHGRRYHRKNTFHDFLLFSVDEQQTIAQPKQKDAQPQPANASKEERRN